MNDETKEDISQAIRLLESNEFKSCNVHCGALLEKILKEIIKYSLGNLKSSDSKELSESIMKIAKGGTDYKQFALGSLIQIVNNNKDSEACDKESNSKFNKYGNLIDFWVKKEKIENPVYKTVHLACMQLARNEAGHHNEDASYKYQNLQFSNYFLCVIQAFYIDLHWITNDEIKKINKTIKSKIEKDQDNDFHSVLEKLGVIDAKPILKDTEYAPKGVMERTTKTLSFMGILGSKWIKDDLFEKFENFLQRIEDKNGKVRFLLIEPYSKAFKALKDRREIRDESMEKLYKLTQRYEKTFEVRLYNDLPNFRLVFIDDKFLTVSRYRNGFEQYSKTEQGKLSPYIVFDNSESSLYCSFETFFNSTWDKYSKKLDDCIDNIIEQNKRYANENQS
jgi:hypothetical protein